MSTPFEKAVAEKLECQARNTVRELTVTFGFAPELAEKAVAAIGDKSDVQLAYNWILDTGEEDRGGCVTLKHCPHLDYLAAVDLVGIEQLRYSTECAEDPGVCPGGETWLCLHCGETRCSRYVCAHAMKHWRDTKALEEASQTVAQISAGAQPAIGHHLALSLSDLSVWCYVCEAYVDVTSGQAAPAASLVRRVEALKFGTTPTDSTMTAASKAPPEAASVGGLCVGDALIAPLEEAHGSTACAQPGSAEVLKPPLVAAAAPELARPGYRMGAADEYLDDEASLRWKVGVLAQMVRVASATVALTGAGISTSAGIKDYATKAASSVAGVGSTAQGSSSFWQAKPTLAHRVLVAMHARGRLAGWVQQNHDGLPQKGGLPQHALNEIHGSWYDPSNPVVPMDATLRPDLHAGVLAAEEEADLVLALGTTLCGMNCDRVASSVALRARARRGGALGLVIVNLQRTQYDAVCQLRLWAPLDQVFQLLAVELGITAAELPPRTFAIPKCVTEAALQGRKDVYTVPYDSGGRHKPDGVGLKLDLSEGARVQPVDLRASARASHTHSVTHSVRIHDDDRCFNVRAQVNGWEAASPMCSPNPSECAYYSRTSIGWLGSRLGIGRAWAPWARWSGGRPPVKLYAFVRAGLTSVYSTTLEGHYEIEMAAAGVGDSSSPRRRLLGLWWVAAALVGSVPILPLVPFVDDDATGAGAK